MQPQNKNVLPAFDCRWAQKKDCLVKKTNLTTNLTAQDNFWDKSKLQRAVEGNRKHIQLLLSRAGRWTQVDAICPDAGGTQYGGVKERHFALLCCSAPKGTKGKPRLVSRPRVTPSCLVWCFKRLIRCKRENSGVRHAAWFTSLFKCQVWIPEKGEVLGMSPWSILKVTTGKKDLWLKRSKALLHFNM